MEISGEGNLLLAGFILILSSLCVVPARAAAPCRDLCGNTSIRYPFGIDYGCGEQIHQLVCNNSGAGPLTLPTAPIVTITQINYEEHTVTINTTLFMKQMLSGTDLPTSCKLPVPINESGYNVSGDTVILCDTADDDFKPVIPVPHCELVRNERVEYKGFTCFSYTKQDPAPPPSPSEGQGGVPSAPGYDDGGNGTPPPSWPWISYAQVPWDIVGSSTTKDLCETCQDRVGGTCGFGPDSGFICLCDDLRNVTYNEMQAKATCQGTASTPSALPVPRGAKKRSQTTAIAGGVAGGAGLAAAVLVAAVCWRKRRQGQVPVSSKGSSNTQFLEQRTESGRNYSYSGGSSTRFTLEELQLATNGFSEAGRLGDGGFGTVYKGQLQDGRLVAVKKLNPWNAQGKCQFDNEVIILSQVKHPHLVQLYGCCLEGRELLLVYEFVANGTLADHLHGSDSNSSIKSSSNPICSFLDWETRLTIVTQTAEALAFLHTEVQPPIFHRDVKSTNILIDECFHAKVGDFGLSRLVPSLELTHVTTAPQGTPGYLDPDYHQSYQLTDKSDVYSLGVVLMEIVSAKRAVDMSRGRKEINLAALAVARIQEGRLDDILDRRLGSAGDVALWCMVRKVAELGFRCLAAEKDDRPCMREVAGQLREALQEARLVCPTARARSLSVGGGRAPSLSPTSVVQAASWRSSTTSPIDSSNDSIV